MTGVRSLSRGVWGQTQRRCVFGGRSAAFPRGGRGPGRTRWFCGAGGSVVGVCLIHMHRVAGGWSVLISELGCILLATRFAWGPPLPIWLSGVGLVRFCRGTGDFLSKAQPYCSLMRKRRLFRCSGVSGGRVRASGTSGLTHIQLGGIFLGSCVPGRSRLVLMSLPTNNNPQQT